MSDAYRMCELVGERCESRGNSSLTAGACCGDTNSEMIGNRTENIRTGVTMMEHLRFPAGRNAKSDPRRAKPNRTYDLH